MAARGQRALAQGADRRKQHGGAGLVVDKARFEIAVGEAAARLERDDIARLHAERAGLRGSPDVLVEHDADVGAKIGGRDAQLLLRHVDRVRRAADRAGEDTAVARVDAHVLAHAVEGVEPAHGAYVQRAVGVEVAHHQPDVVEMGRDGQRVALAAEIGDYAALVQQRVRHAELVQHPADERLDLLVLAGRAVRPEQLFKSLKAVFFVEHDVFLSSCLFSDKDIVALRAADCKGMMMPDRKRSVGHCLIPARARRSIPAGGSPAPRSGRGSTCRSGGRRRRRRICKSCRAAHRRGRNPLCRRGP